MQTPQGEFWADPVQDSKMYHDIQNGYFYDEDYQNRVKQYLQGGDVVDVGANIGETSVAYAPFAKTVYAFEPVERSRFYLQKNTERFKNVVIVPVALGETEGRVSLTPDNPKNSGTYRVRGTGNIPIKTLDSYSLTPRFIKIDVQGMERSVLRGAQQTLMRQQPAVLFELSDLTVMYGVRGMRKLLAGYKLTYFPSGQPVLWWWLLFELYLRRYLNRPRHYDILAVAN